MVEFNLNGKTVKSATEDDTPLLWVIRDEQITSTMNGNPGPASTNIHVKRLLTVPPYCLPVGSWINCRSVMGHAVEGFTPSTRQRRNQ